MKTYRVTVTYCVEVTAKDENSALNEAREQIEECNWWIPRDYEVEEVDENKRLDNKETRWLLVKRVSTDKKYS